jgi:medium-chain acyl-[acyl-carrier-protein] hydrolase
MGKAIQLFLFPFAGGSSNSFKNFIGELDDSIEPVTVEYAGRGHRNKEPFIVDYKEFLEDVGRFVNDVRKKDLQFATLGYSLGSAISFDLITRGIIERPKHIVMCARGDLSKDSPSKRFASLDEESFVEKITSLGGIDSRILENKRFRDIYFRPLRADYKIWGSYEYNNRMLDSDVTVFYSSKDDTCNDVKGWNNLTTGLVDYHELGDNHFFINEYYKVMAKIINAKLLGDN